MIKFIVFTTLLLAVAFASLETVNIERVYIKENFYVSETHKMTAVPLSDVDAIYPASVRIDNFDRSVLFDTTSSHNWKF